MRGEKVVSSDAKEHGIATGVSFKCRMSGCSGTRITTRWPDGRITHPCSRGMEYSEVRHEWRILS